MIGVEMINPQIRDIVIEQSFRRGLLILGAGPSTIRLSPPLVIDEEQADAAVSILESALPS
jgi:4-aminobutyrate aminotransferase